jgi:hypothetical protein
MPQAGMSAELFRNLYQMEQTFHSFLKFDTGTMLVLAPAAQ